MHALTHQHNEQVVVIERPVEIIDEAALEFDAFYEGNYRSIANALALTLRDRDLAGEATDEAMARAFARWGAVSHYANPSGWVYRVGLNWSRSTLRRISRRPQVEFKVAENPSMIDDLALAQALAKLDVKLRSIVVCRFLLDWSVEDTAAAVNVRPGTVKSRLHRALKQLEQHLDAPPRTSQEPRSQ